jgi:hypothetical protein
MTNAFAVDLSNAIIISNNKQKIKHFCDFSGCSKKLSLVDIHRVCKCSKRFCDQHRCFDSHKCDFVYQREDKAYEQTRCVRQKVEII